MLILENSDRYLLKIVELSPHLRRERLLKFLHILLRPKPRIDIAVILFLLLETKDEIEPGRKSQSDTLALQDHAMHL